MPPRMLLGLALSCGNRLMPALRAAARKRRLEAPVPAVTLRGASGSVSILVSLRDRTGRPYRAVEMTRAPGLPSVAQAANGHQDDARLLIYGTRAG